MYKTIWYINNGESITEFTYYHFGKEPKFPSWYVEEGFVYEIEMKFNLRLVPTLKMFYRCLSHTYIVK